LAAPLIGEARDRTTWQNGERFKITDRSATNCPNTIQLARVRRGVNQASKPNIPWFPLRECLTVNDG
jgi:hypothetical protein